MEKKKLTLCPGHSWTPVDFFFLFSRGFCNFCPKFPKAIGKKTMEVREWLAHVCSGFSHGLGALPESYLKPWEEIKRSQDLRI
jgi:hypothetical protein